MVFPITKVSDADPAFFAFLDTSDFVIMMRLVDSQKRRMGIGVAEQGAGGVLHIQGHDYLSIRSVARPKWPLEQFTR